MPKYNVTIKHSSIIGHDFTAYRVTQEAEDADDAVAKAMDHVLSLEQWPSYMSIEERMKYLSLISIQEVKYPHD